MISSSKLRESLPSFRLPVLQDAGLIPPEEQEWFDLYRRTYSEGQGVHYETGEPADEYHESKTYVDRALPVIERQVASAVRNGNESVMDFIRGLDGDDGIDIAYWEEYEKIKDLFRQEPRYTDFTNSIFQCVIYSSAVPPTGRGKSNTMYTLVEMAQTVYPNLRVITNNTSDDFETAPEQWEDIERLVRSDDGWKLLCIDEAAQFLQYADQSGGKTVSQCLKLLRHNHCHLLMVGHTGMDIPADIRRQVFFLDKQSQKQGVFGYGITSNDIGTMEVANELFKVSKIPPTNLDYDDIDDEGIEIKFDGGGVTSEYIVEGLVREIGQVSDEIAKIEELEEKRRDLIRELDEEGDLTIREIADAANVSKSKVSNILSEEFE
ncbi:winged helix-turn-helix transcriptional regulator [Halopiger djelfimassiliensis]|uniref:winged helix-turn-helix transcriptional regulator n=1 Tax=Halopiger djelfimassiliensis TaxID=1293047 RepID=UPI0006777E3F|nr:winged helix-turn-helix transcriptional regulator [Halopiger djelfimassiliensis]